MFEKEEKLRGYLKNVSCRLVNGGKFIGTTIDSERLVHKIRHSGKEGHLTIGNEYYSVVFGQDTFTRRESAFGHQYYFYLQDSVGLKRASDG